jgi:hypothetical protein
MSDDLPDSVRAARLYCPDCEPLAEESADLLSVVWCETHAPERGGIEDGNVGPWAYLNGSAEAGGEANRSFCELLHRRKTLLRGPA